MKPRYNSFEELRDALESNVDHYLRFMKKHNNSSDKDYARKQMEGFYFNIFMHYELTEEESKTLENIFRNAMNEWIELI